MSLNIHCQHMLLVSCLSALFGCADGEGKEDAKPAPPEWSQWLCAGASLSAAAQMTGTRGS